MRWQWSTWKVPAEDYLYIKGDYDGSFTIHQKLTCDYDKDVLEAQQTLPENAVPVDVKENENTWVVNTNHCRWVLPPPPPPAPWKMDAFIQQLPQWEKDLLSGLELLVPQDELMMELAHANVVVAADGSVQETKASFGWVKPTWKRDRFGICCSSLCLPIEPPPP